MPPPVTMMMSSRKLNVFVRLYRVLSIAFWNSAGMSVSPYNPLLNRYVLVALPPMILKLHCFAVSSSSGNWLYAYRKSIVENRTSPSSDD